MSQQSAAALLATVLSMSPPGTDVNEEKSVFSLDPRHAPNLHRHINPTAPPRSPFPSMVRQREVWEIQGQPLFNPPPAEGWVGRWWGL